MNVSRIRKLANINVATPTLSPQWYGPPHTIGTDVVSSVTLYTFYLAGRANKIIGLHWLGRVSKQRITEKPFSKERCVSPTIPRRVAAETRLAGAG